MQEPLFWLLLNVFTIVVLAFYSMEEMAFVSFNKVRLQFYVAQGSQRAIWINNLLNNSSKLFSTTLIGVNVATFVGSECARRFHEALGISPDLAPLSQVILVIIFGELAPMFAARRYSEHVALLGVPLIYFSSLVLAPFIWILEIVSKVANRLFRGSETSPNLFITADELQKIIEEQDEEANDSGSEFNAVTSNIFRLKEKFAHQAMTPLSHETAVSEQMTVKELRNGRLIKDKYLVVYRQNLSHTVGIVYINDLLKAGENQKLLKFCRSPWFIASTTPLIEILKQFRMNSENIAIILDHKGKSIGYITFEDILDEIFGERGTPIRKAPSKTFIDRTFDGSITLETLKKETGIELAGKSDETLSDWFFRVVDHHPEAGESYLVPPYEFIVKETSLRAIVSIEVKTRQS